MAKKNKIPRKLAGVKIPKVLRKNSVLKALLGSPAGRQIVGEALLAAATAAAAALVASHPKQAAKAGTAVKNAGDHTGDLLKTAVKSAATALTGSLGKAAKLALDDSVSRKGDRSRQVRTH